MWRKQNIRSLLFACHKAERCYFFPFKGGVTEKKLTLFARWKRTHYEESEGPTSNLCIWQLMLFFPPQSRPTTIPIKVARLDSSQSTPPKFEYSLSRHLTTTISEKDYHWRQYYIKIKIWYDLWFITWLTVFRETKRNETKWNETKRNETKRNETKRNETKRND